ncbi:ABC transporter permease [Ktedonosporobacter rubrisoli]|uniref:Transport permease protein n=1 Tax=Ktedonosporobacter rubrisoli TaxID=2509675 RepID=A0A4P6JSG8_KTERU|nr:ABC transporter permease [Ktedonosporobacter rubrisoli]QBD78344.1 ABC transporter permease [Ktedonosporobacter rubrisoli]
MSPSNHKPSLMVQLLDVFLIELTNWRWSWRSILITSTITPLISVLGLGTFARSAGPSATAYVLTGSAVLSLLFSNLNNLQGHVVFMRFMGTLDYFATLPIRRPILILAMIAAFFLLSLPSLLITILVGTLFLHIQLVIHPLLLLVIPLCALALSSLGVLIGVNARTPEESGAFTLLFTLVLTAAGPVIIPPDHLPSFLLIIGYFSPTTYASAALRQTLLGPVTHQLLFDIAILSGLAVFTLWLAARKLDWRHD